MCIIGFKCRSQWIDWSFWLFVSPVYSTTVWTTVFYLEVTGNHPAILALKEWNPLPFIKEKINIWSGEKTSRVLCLWLAMIFSHMFFFKGLVTEVNWTQHYPGLYMSLVHSPICLIRQNTSSSLYFDTGKALTKWIFFCFVFCLFCECEKFKQLLSFSDSAVRCFTMNVNEKKNKMKNGRDFWYLAVL